MSDVQDLEIEMRRALEKNDGSTWTAAIEMHNAGWRKLMPGPQAPSVSNVDAMRGVVKSLGPCDVTDAVWALHVAGWRKCVGEAVPPPPGPRNAQQEAKRIMGELKALLAAYPDDMQLVGPDLKKLEYVSLMAVTLNGLGSTRRD